MRRATGAIVTGLAASVIAAVSPRAEGPPATVGRAVALSVAVNAAGEVQHGVAFPIRVASAPGTGRLEASAVVDDMMRQTVAAACGWIAAQRGRAGFRVPPDFPHGYDIALQFLPQAEFVGGDSAGVAIACALYSALSGAPVLDDVAMTGAVHPDGRVGAVAHIRTKLEGVLDRGFATMILPAENWTRTASEARQVWLDAVPEVHVVFAATLDDAFFFAFGPYGPQADQYARYTETLADGLSLYDHGDFERARSVFVWLLAWHPGDSTAYVWSDDSGRRYAHRLLRSAVEALREGRRETAAFLCSRAARVGGEEVEPEARRVAWLVSNNARPEVGSERPTLVRGDPNSTLTVRARFVEPPPRKVTDAGWAGSRPTSLPLGRGSVSVAIERGWADLSLALSADDQSGRAEDNAGRWVLAADGFAEQVAEDRIAVAFGPEDQASVAALAGLEMRGLPGCDTWLFGAGPIRASDYAGDLAPLPDVVPAFDSGLPPLMRNEGPAGVPAGAYDGLLGSADNPMVLEASEAGILRGDPLAGRTAFAAKCASCHGPDAEGLAALVASGAALEPWGSQGLLEHWLRQDPDHRTYATEEEQDNLIAYMRITEPVPAWLVCQPEGSSADVRLSSSFHDGRWWLVFRRRLETGNPDDLSFSGEPSLHVAVAALDGSSGKAAVTPAARVIWE